MPSVKRKITKRSVDSLAPDPTGERVIMWDTEIGGFNFVRLHTGTGSYRYLYRTAEGRERHPTIGKHGAWTPDQARSAAEDMRETVRAGRDPLAEKTERKQAPTVGEILDAYLESEAFTTKAQTTQASDRGRIERHLRPLLGRKHVHALTPADIVRASAAIRDGKTATRVKTKPRGLARVTGGDGAANQSIILLRTIFNWGVKIAHIAKSNPCEGVKTAPSGMREIILSGAAHYASLFETCDRVEQQKRFRGPVVDGIRFITLTGARRGEVTGLRWKHVDLKRGIVTLDAKSHKTGRKTGKARVIGLPAAAQAIIARQPAGEPEDYVFRPAHGAGPISLSKAWRVVRVEAKLPAGIGLHGLRHSLASHMAMNGAGAPELMEFLGHRQLSTTTRYLHWAQDARQALAERAASVAIAGMAASSGKKAAAVTPLPTRKSD